MMADRKNESGIKDALQAWLEKSRLQQKYNETKLIQSWEELMGKMIAGYTEKIYIRNHVLYVKLTSSPLKNELHMSKTKILERFNNEVGENIVLDIKIL